MRLTRMLTASGVDQHLIGATERRARAEIAAAADRALAAPPVDPATALDNLYA